MAFGQIINVKDPMFNGGAKGDNVTDDWSAVNAAFMYCTAAYGTVIYFPPGTYRLDKNQGSHLTNPMTVPAGQFDVYVRGEPGSDAAIIYLPPQYGGVVLGDTNNCGVSDLTLKYEYQETDLSAAISASGGGNIAISDITFISTNTNVSVTDCSNVYISNCLSVKADPSTAPGSNAADIVLDGSAGAGTQEVHITNCIFGGSTKIGTVVTNSLGPGMHLKSCSGVFVTASDFVRFHDGLRVDPQDTYKVYNVQFTTCNWDVATNAAVLIQPAGGMTGGSVYALHFSGCFSGGSGTGFAILPNSTSVGVNDIMLIGQMIEGNSGYGLEMNNGTASTLINRITITGGVFSGNGSTNSGIRISGTVNDVVISGAGLYPQTKEHDNSQEYAVALYTSTGTPTNVVITGCDMKGYSAPVLYPSSALSGCIFANNIGLNPTGFSITTPSLPGSGTSQTNNFPFAVDVCMTGGTWSVMKVTDMFGTTKTLTSPLPSVLTLQPAEAITVTYGGAFAWSWKGH